MTTASLAPQPNFRSLNLSATGPNAGGKLFTYISGTTTPQVTYTSSTAMVPNANPVIFDANGFANVWLDASLTYTFLETDSTGTPIRTQDGISNSAGTTGAPGTFACAQATGTVDAITASYSPVLTLADKTMCAFISSGKNTLSNPTFGPDGLTAHTITKLGGQVLIAGDIGSALTLHILEYNLANTRWELLNPVGAIPLAAGATGQVLTAVTGGLPVWATASSGITYNAQSAGYTILTTDNGAFIDFTGSSDATFAFTAAATLVNKWFCYIRNNGTSQAVLTLDPNSSETIDGLASYPMYPGEVRLVQCNGTLFTTFIIQGFNVRKTATFTFINPPGYKAFKGFLWGSGASGGKGATNGGGGGGGGACVPFDIQSSKIGAAGTSTTVTIGAGGTSQTVANTAGNAGNSSTFGALFTSYGGGRGGGSTAGAGGGGGGTGYVTAGAAVSGVGGNATTTTPGTGGVGWSSVTPTVAAVFGLAYNGAGGGGTSVAGGGGIYGGGGGSGGAATGLAGGTSVYGGGGGGGADAASPGGGGSSQYGGAGGAGASGANNATAGTAPSGAGGGCITGNSGAGGDGGCEIQGIV